MEKQKREASRLALMQLTICQAQGVKVNGRKPTIADFLPEYAKPKRKPRQTNEAAIKAGLKALTQ